MKTMLQTWFSDILVTNEDEAWLRIRNYELRINKSTQSTKQVKILIQTIHQANQNQGNHINSINQGSGGGNS